MEEDKLINNITNSEKISRFIKNHFDNIILVGVCFFYIFKDIANIEESGSTIAEIIAYGFISFMIGILIKISRKKKGIADGLFDPKFIATANVYGDKKQEISDDIHLLGDFCDKRNAKRLKVKQSEYLLNYAMKYDKFINGDYDNDSDKKEIIEKVRKIKIFNINDTMLTNAYSDSEQEEKILSQTIQKYQKKGFAWDMVISFLCLILFGFFQLGKGTFDFTAILWSSLQIFIYLMLGQIKYLNSKYFVTEILRNKIMRVIVILDEFKNECKNLDNKNV